MNTEINKTKWKCRRGLRELDLLFRRYSEAKLDSLSKEEFEMFNSILDLEDQALYDFIFKNESLGSPEKESFILNNLKKYSNLKVLQSDGTKFKTPELCDVIFSLGVIHHIKNPIDILKNINFTNSELEYISTLVDVKLMSHQHAADFWLKENTAIWQAWISEKCL